MSDATLPEFRMIVLNDIHFTRHAPECRADSYAHEVLDKLHEVARIADRLKVGTIACTGDWFHRKGKVTFRESNDLLAVLMGWHRRGIDVLGILGNHDIAGHRIESLDNRAVGALVHSQALQLLDYEPYRAHTVYVTGSSYFHGCDADDEGRAKMYGAPGPEREDGDLPFVHVHLAHGTLLQKGTFFEEFTTAPELIELLAERDRLPDVIVCGHLHFPEGIKLYPNPLRPQYPDGRTRHVAVCRVGSLARVASDDFERQPEILLVVSRGEKFVCKAIPVGKEVLRGGETPDSRDPAEHEARIKEFVRVLREEADEWELAQHDVLIKELAERMGYGEDVAEIALKAVERRQ